MLLCEPVSTMLHSTDYCSLGGALPLSYTTLIKHFIENLKECNVQFRKISPPPMEGQWKFEGGGVGKANDFIVKYGAKLEFVEG